jgi:hypothetical protein
MITYRQYEDFSVQSRGLSRGSEKSFGPESPMTVREKHVSNQTEGPSGSGCFPTTCMREVSCHGTQGVRHKTALNLTMGCIAPLALLTEAFLPRKEEAGSDSVLRVTIVQKSPGVVERAENCANRRDPKRSAATNA